jgi:hypothetical protein
MCHENTDIRRHKNNMLRKIKENDYDNDIFIIQVKVKR